VYKLFNNKVTCIVVLVLVWFYSSVLFGQVLTEDDVRQVLASSGVEESFRKCVLEHPCPDAIVAKFIYHKEGRLQFVSTEPPVSRELSACFEEATEHIVITAPGRSYNITYPLKLNPEEKWIDENDEAEKNCRTTISSSMHSKWTAGKALYYSGLAATLLGSGGLIAGHVLIYKENSAGIPLIVLPYFFTLAGNILSLIGLKIKANALRLGGDEIKPGLFKISLGTFIVGASLSVLLSIAFVTEMVVWSYSSMMCELDPEECSAANDTYESIFNGIWMGLAASHALLFLSIIPRIVLHLQLNNKMNVLKKRKLASVPFVSYGFMPGLKTHFISFAWTF